MPQAFLAFVGTVGGLIIQGTVAVFGEAAALFILDLGSKLAGLSLLGYISGKLTKTPDFSVQAQSQQIISRSTLDHQRIIYGETLVSGTLQYLNVAGTHNQALFHSIIIAGHEIEDITEVWLDETRIESGYIDWSGIGANDGGVNSGDFRGDSSLQTPVFFEKNLGGSNQAASSVLSFFFAEVTSQHQGRGLAYLVTRFDYADGQTQVWSKGAPDSIKCLARGKLVYDPRSDSSQSFGTGPHRVNSAPTWEYSNNPALCWADYLIDTSLGVGMATSKIDYGYVASAANICDEVVFTPVGTDVRFACNGVLFAGDTHETNLNKILSSFNGSQARMGGQLKVRAFAYDTPTLQLNEDMLRQDLQIKLDVDEDDRYNAVRGYFIDKDRLYKPQQFPAFVSSEYRNRDNDELKYEDIQLPMTTDIYMAQRLAAGILELSDLQETVVFPSNFKSLPAEINGTIQLSVDKMAWVNEDFRVVNYKFTDLQGIDLVLRKESSAAYVDVGTAEYVISSQGSYVTAEAGVPAPSSIWVQAGANRNIVRWTPPPARLFETVRVYASKTTSYSDASLVADTDSTEAEHTIDVPSSYWYWVQAVNYAGETSDRLPNSNFSDVSAVPQLLDTFPDMTFDKSDDYTDFYEADGFGATNSVFINTTSGFNDTHAMAMFLSQDHTGSSRRTAYPKVRHQILSDTMILRARYMVHSYNGIDFPNSAGLVLQAYGYDPDPTPTPTVPPIIGGATLQDLGIVFFPVASLSSVNTWGIIEATITTSEAWTSGWKLGVPAWGVWTPASHYIHVLFDDIAFRYE